MMEEIFENIRKNTIGYDATIQTPYGEKPLVYSDWTASGRLYRPIEKKISELIGPYIANTHTESSFTGSYMTELYHQSKIIVKQHVNAGQKDAILFCGSGMTGAINKLQRIMGMRIPASAKNHYSIKAPDKARKPIVFISHMEHHSNHTSWLETVADVRVINHLDAGTIDLEDLKEQLRIHKNRPLKIVSVTACSNVTGIETPVYNIAAIAHENNAYCFVDYACSGPYVSINMHPEEKENLDAVFLSPHKFLGGPGTPGIAIFNTELYHSKVPDNPGGGTVKYTNPWNEHEYYDDIEVREDGGTPPFIQGIKTGMAIRLKESIGHENMISAEKKIGQKVFKRFKEMPAVQLLAENCHERLGVYSFYIKDLHYNLGVRLLNDLYGIQVRGGCACAGTYGHILLKIDYDTSHEYLEHILNGKLYKRPGWIRMSIHPMMTEDEINYIMDAIEDVSQNHGKYSGDYEMIKENATFHFKGYKGDSSSETFKTIFENVPEIVQG